MSKRKGKVNLQVLVLFALVTVWGGVALHFQQLFLLFAWWEQIVKLVEQTAFLLELKDMDTNELKPLAYGVNITLCSIYLNLFDIYLS